MGKEKNLSQLLQEEAGLPENWVVKEAPPVKPGAPAAPQDTSNKYLQGSLPPSYQHDGSFVKTAYSSPTAPNTPLVPLGQNAQPSFNAATQSVVKEYISTAVSSASQTIIQNIIENAFPSEVANVGFLGPTYGSGAAVPDFRNFQSQDTPQIGVISAADYGADSNPAQGKISFDVSMTSGSATLTSSIPCFQFPLDDHKTIVVYGAGAGGSNLWAKIIKINSSTNVTLDTPASNSVAPGAGNNSNTLIYGCAVWFSPGKDDTAAIQAAINDACTGGNFTGFRVRIPRGVYIISAPLVIPAVNSLGETVTQNPSAIYGDGSDNTFLVAQNPALAAENGIINFPAPSSLNVSGFSVLGDIVPLAGTPNTGAEVSISTLNSEISDISVLSTAFQNDVNIQNSFGLVQGLFGCAQAVYDLDGTLLSNTQHAAFLFNNGEGGSVVGCGAGGDFPFADACYEVANTNGGDLVFESCGCVGGSSSIQTPVGYRLSAGGSSNVSLYGCSAGGNLQTGFLLGSNVVAYGCEVRSGCTGAAFALGDCVAWAPSTPFHDNQEIVDPNGNIQTVSTDGTSGGTQPTWATVNGATTSDGTVTWTCSNTGLISQPDNIAIRDCKNFTSGTFDAVTHGTSILISGCEFNSIGVYVSGDAALEYCSNTGTITAASGFQPGTYTTVDSSGGRIVLNADNAGVSIGSPSSATHALDVDGSVHASDFFTVGAVTAQDVSFFNRIEADQGTPITSAQIVPSAGFGSTASVSAVTGFDQAFQFTVTANGSGIGANPTLTISFINGAWNEAPLFLVQRNDLNAPYGAPPHTVVVTATTITITFNGTPSSGTSYKFLCSGMGL